jgi:hypothetical protein
MARSTFVRGQLFVASAGRDRRKKQSQTKPLTSSALESIRYVISWQNKAIDVNCLFFNYLWRKKADSSKRMNGARGSQVLNGPKSRSQESGVRRQDPAEGRKRLTNEAGMSFIINSYSSRFIPQVPNGRGAVAGRGDVVKKCEKMRNEATTLLKKKEIDWERTQIRTQIKPNRSHFRVGFPRFGSVRNWEARVSIFESPSLFAFSS